MASTFNAASGDGYELQMGRWSQRLAERFVDFAGVQHGEHVLDAGCGTESLTFALARRARGLRIDGIDFWSAYVDYARHRLQNADVGDARVSFAQGDITALPFADASFDRVLALLVLHFVADPARGVSELRRVARPGATVAATVWDARGGVVSHRIFWDTAAALDPGAIEQRNRHCTRPMTRPGELGAAWRAAGLTDVRETTLTIRMEFASFADFWAPNEGQDGPIPAYVGSLGAPLRERIHEAVRAAYLDGDPDGPRSYAALAWAVVGLAPR